MSKLVVAWIDSKGVEYNAQTLYDPETDDYWDWNGYKVQFIKRVTEATPTDLEADNGK